MTDLLGTSHKIDLSNTVDPEEMAQAFKEYFERYERLGIGFITQAQYLSPASESGWQFCPFRSPGCESSCLGHSSGLMVTSTSKQARINRSTLLMTDRIAYGAKAIKEISALERKAIKANKRAAVRLNADSDIRWESMRFGGMTLMDRFKDCQFYDYTKWPSHLRQNLPANYHLTYSRSELTTSEDIKREIDSGRNVAVVFDAIPTTWEGLPVIDGTKNDLRFLDPTGVIVGLKTIGLAKKDITGFVVRLVTKVVNGKIVKL
jgi:hypothetical protein